MGSTNNTSTSTTGSNNKDVTATISKLAKGLGDAYTPGASLYTAPGANTTGGWAASLGAANNSGYANSIGNAINSYGATASGANIGQNDPGYAAIRSKLSNDVMTGTNAAFNGSGLFGSDSNQKAAASGLTDSLGALDYGQYKDSLNRQTEAANMLPQLFSAAQLPSSIQQSVGASQDANTAAQAAGPTDYLAKMFNIANGASQAAGTTTTTTKPGTPLWRSLLGLGISAL